jgi:hypothetical protein
MLSMMLFVFLLIQSIEKAPATFVTGAFSML